MAEQNRCAMWQNIFSVCLPQNIRLLQLLEIELPLHLAIVFG